MYIRNLETLYSFSCDKGGGGGGGGETLFLVLVVVSLTNIVPYEVVCKLASYPGPKIGPGIHCLRMRNHNNDHITSQLQRSWPQKYPEF